MATRCYCSEDSWLTQRLPKLTATTAKVWNKADLCEQCATIDFDMAVNQSPVTDTDSASSTTNSIPEEEFSVSLPESSSSDSEDDKLSTGSEDDGPVLCSSRQSSCPACRFFADVASRENSLLEPDDVVEYTLHAKDITYESHQWRQVTTHKQIIRVKPHGKFHYIRNPDRAGVWIGEDEQHIGEVHDPAKVGWNVPAVSCRLVHPRAVDYSMLQGWITHCQTHHIRVCQSSWLGYSQKNPVLRVIDCKTRTLVGASNDTEYAALSYVWGSALIDCREDAFVSSDGARLPEDLPLTVSDAMDVVLGLNLQYLWVDKYCINQSDVNELQSQLNRMDMVYDRATVTIIAACGEDAAFGLPGVSTRSKRPQPTFNLEGRIFVSTLKSPFPVVEDSKWYARGWTFQEGLFSRRRLVFTEEQIYFECNTLACNESVVYDLHRLKDVSPGVPSGVFNGGFNYGFRGLNGLIWSYSRRQLTCPGDVLNAFAGVLRAFARMHNPIRQLWGIPIDCRDNPFTPWPFDGVVSRQWGPSESVGCKDVNDRFARALCWDLRYAGARRAGFPSWSWLGWMAPMSLDEWGSIGNYRVMVSGAQFWIRKDDGQYEKLTDSVVDEFDVPDASSKGFTYKLKVDAPTVKLRLVDETRSTMIREARSDDSDDGLDSPRDAHLFQAQVRQGNDDIPATELYSSTCWDLDLLVNASEELDHALRTGDFECILLQPNFGIVVKDRKDGVWERIGHIPFFRESWSVESGEIVNETVPDNLLIKQRTFELV